MSIGLGASATPSIEPPVIIDSALCGAETGLSRGPRPSLLLARIVTCLVAIDLVSIIAGIGIVTMARSAVLGGTDISYLLVTVVPIYLLAAVNTHAYSTRELNHALNVSLRALRALTIAIAVVVFIAFTLKTSESVTRLVTIAGYLMSACIISVGRYVFAHRYLSRVGADLYNMILIRDGDVLVPPGDFSTVIPAGVWLDPDSHDPVMYDRLAKMLQCAGRVVVSCPPERRIAWAHALKGASIQGEIFVPELSALRPLGVASTDIQHNGTAVTMVVATGSLELSDRAIKRAFDIAMATCMLLLLSPILVCVALAIKLESPGPVLFRQPRIGRGNEIFQIIKFRSMRIEKTDNDGHRSAVRNDDRITRVGRIIRAASIDELPQFLNVLKGDMSIVGPRPHALGSRAEDKLFWEIDHRYWHRHAAKPGLTGLAQVRGFRGATLVEADLANRLQADLEYLENWSLWRDIKLVLLTLRVIIHRNAF